MTTTRTRWTALLTLRVLVCGGVWARFDRQRSRHQRAGSGRQDGGSCVAGGLAEFGFCPSWLAIPVRVGQPEVVVFGGLRRIGFRATDWRSERAPMLVGELTHDMVGKEGGDELRQEQGAPAARADSAGGS